LQPQSRCDGGVARALDSSFGFPRNAYKDGVRHVWRSIDQREQVWNRYRDPVNRSGASRLLQ
jgi:hypothetical protein